jgi:8-oxo-dGTP diphosphatase
MRFVDLVRHADAESRERWWGSPDRERPLTDKGMRQAAALARDLRDGPRLAVIRSSPFVRCLQTVVPLAAAVRLGVGEEPALAERTVLPPLAQEEWEAAAWFAGRSIGAMDRLLAELADDERGVLCSHGDVVPAVLAALHGRDELELERLRLKKGAWCRLTFDGAGRAVAAEHHPVPEVAPA